MTITNQTNPVGSSYTSKKSYIAVPREGNIFIKETTFTTLRLTKTTNNPPTYRKEILILLFFFFKNLIYLLNDAIFIEII